MTTPPEGPTPPGGSDNIRQDSASTASTIARRLMRPAQIIIVSSVMFTFISYWRTAAVVLCDLASTAYYIGGIVEQSIGPAAPWFILAVMCLQLRRALGVHRKLHAVRPRRRLSRRHARRWANSWPSSPCRP